MGLKLFKSARKRRKLNKTKAKRTLKEDWEKVVKKFGGSLEKINLREFKPYIASSDPLMKVLNFHSDRLVSKFPSLSPSPKSVSIPKPNYTGDMKRRELVALKEIERKKMMIAPLYNKGPAAYVAGYDPKDLGKKT